jgi:PAS domain-containing protein
MSQLRNKNASAAMPIALASSAFFVPGLLLAGGATVLGSLVLEGAWAGALAALVVSCGAFVVQKWNGAVRPSDALVDAMPCAGLIVDAAGGVRRANAAAQQWFGAPGCLPQALVPIVQALIADSSAAEFTVKVLVEGGERWMHANFRLGAEDHRQQRRVAVLALTDVTVQRAHGMELAKLAQALALAESRRKVLSEVAADAVITCGPDGVLRSWSTGSDRLFGYSEVGGLSRHLATFASEFELANLDGSLVAVEDWPFARLLRGEEHLDLELLVRRLDDGSIRRLRYRG